MALAAIRLIAFDLDGTALNSRGEITSRLRQAFAAAEAAGILLAPATGRNAAEVRSAALGLPRVRYAVCGNGARVYDLWEGRLLHRRCFSPDAAAALAGELLQEPAVTFCCYEAESLAGFGPLIGEERRVAEARFTQMERQAVDDLPARIRRNGREVDKFLQYYLAEPPRLQALERYRRRPGCAVSSSFPHSLELNAPGADKGAGLAFLAAHLSIPAEQVMAVGDNLNDLKMLRFAGYGVAMGNAAPEAKQAAKHIAPSCDEDGLAVVLEGILRGRC